MFLAACRPSWVDRIRSTSPLRDSSLFILSVFPSILVSTSRTFRSFNLLINLSLTGVIAHVELQVIMGQVMDTFRDRIYGLSSAADEMPSPVVIKVRLILSPNLNGVTHSVPHPSFPSPPSSQLFDSRLNEWRQRWCPVPGEPIANNLLFYFHSSKLYLHSIPLHTMLRKGEAVDDPECVSITISAAKSILDLGHQFAEMNVLVHSPDVIFLIMLYSGKLRLRFNRMRSETLTILVPSRCFLDVSFKQSTIFMLLLP